jgi:hypothetical protein
MIRILAAWTVFLASHALAAGPNGADFDATPASLAAAYSACMAVGLPPSHPGLRPSWEDAHEAPGWECSRVYGAWKASHK